MEDGVEIGEIVGCGVDGWSLEKLPLWQEGFCCGCVREVDALVVADGVHPSVAATVGGDSIAAGRVLLALQTGMGICEDETDA